MTPKNPPLSHHPGPDDIDRILDAMRNLPVLIAGDFMLDRFISGKVERISPESPVPVLAVQREDLMLGGAGNALANAAGLNMKPGLLGVVGADDTGDQIISLAQALGADLRGLIQLPDQNSIVKTRYLSGYQQLLRVDADTCFQAHSAIKERIRKQAEKSLPDVRALILSDYGKGFLDADICEILIALARRHNVPVIVDPKGSDFSKYAGADYITPNKPELSAASGGMPVDSDDDIVNAARKIQADCQVKTIIATRSEQGISIIPSEGDPVHIPTRDIEVYDVSGAGDTVIAVLAGSIAAGASAHEAAWLANLAGSIVVTKAGTAPIRAEELREFEPAPVHVSTIMSDWTEALETVQRWRRRSLKIGFTNGCFDILHKGHVKYLAETRRHCDRLVVGLNTDKSVNILKGAGRPYNDESSRAEVLAGLSSVDLVVLFGAHNAGEDNSAARLIEALKPDIYFKGGDYTEEQIPETPHVKKYGGRVQIMKESEGYSTSVTLDKMRGSGF